MLFVLFFFIFFFFFIMIRRPPRSTPLYSSAASDVYKRQGLRGLIDERGVLDQLVDFGHEQVFTQATTYTCLLFLELSPHATTEYLRVNPKELVESEEESRLVPLSSLSGKPWRFAGAEAETLLAQIAAAGTPLLELPAAMSRGTSTGNDQVFCLQVADGGLATRAGVPVDIEPGILRRPIYATDYTRFRFRPRNRAVSYTHL